MKAIIQDSYGPADVLELRDIDKPPIGNDEVLVQVRGAGVDPGVWHLMTGQPYLIRAMGFGLRKPKVAVRGRDVAGVVEAAGVRVTRFHPGDEVYGTCENGSFAEYAAASQDRLARKPANISFEQAAVAPVSGVTALQAVRDVGSVQPGQQVLVIGAAGGVGSFAVQIAKASGAKVTGICSTPKAGLVRSLGADDIIDYTREEIDRDGPRYDVIIDTGGNRPLAKLRRAMTPRGTPGPSRCRARRRPTARRLRPATPRAAALAVHVAAAPRPDRQGRLRAPRGSGPAHRVRRRQARHRPRLPPRRRSRRDPLPPRRPRRGQSRHHRVSRTGSYRRPTALAISRRNRDIVQPPSPGRRASDDLDDRPTQRVTSRLSRHDSRSRRASSCDGHQAAVYGRRVL